MRQRGELLFSSTAGLSEVKEQSFRLRCDGRFYRLPTGSLLRCVCASPNQVDGQTDESTGERFYWTREVSPDGRQMTISEYHDAHRAKVRSVMVLDRIK